MPHRLLPLALLAALSAQAATTHHDQPPPPAPPPGYDADLWQRAWRLHHDALVLDTHSDTTSRILDENFAMRARARDGHMDLPRIAEGGLDAQFYAIYVAARYYGREDFTSKETQQASLADGSARRAFAMIDALRLTIEANPERMTLCTSVADVRAAVAAGKHAALMGIEGGHAIEGDLRLLREFYRAGVRYMTLTHGNHNQYADSSGEAEPRWGGLNRLGEKVVKEMNRLGMLVDVSHVSDATFWHALRVTRAPVICSHSSCRALCGHPRNVTDEMLRAVAANGGVVMINFNCGFLDDDYGKAAAAYRSQLALREQAIGKTFAPGSPEHEKALADLRQRLRPPEPPGIERLIAHIMHAIEVAGVDHVGLGSDFDGVPCVPSGLDDVTGLPRITYWLLARGIDEAGVRKVLGENLLRVFAAAEQVALSLRAEPPYQNDATDALPGEASEKR
ncbi:MAG TPA: dipeptidase [Planctomycetota bacterium]|nr:dipeptidase [Planctomycetota bacterium]